MRNLPVCIVSIDPGAVRRRARRLGAANAYSFTL